LLDEVRAKSANRQTEAKVTGRIGRLIAVVLALVLAVPAIASAANTMVVQPDGGILVAGQVVGHSGPVGTVARFTPDGKLDPSFGHEGGLVDFRVGPISAIALQANGAILAASGSAAEGIHVARYLPNGQVDPSFGEGGLTASPAPVRVGESFPDKESVAAIVVAPDGSVLVAESSAHHNRYQQHYSLGTVLRFSLTGTYLGATPGANSSYEDLLASSDGSLFASGTSNEVHDGNGEPSISITKYLPGAAAVDRSYGYEGSFEPRFFPPKFSSPSLIGSATALAADEGKLLSAGQIGGQTFLTRSNLNGTVDTGFGNVGYVRETPPGTTSSSASDVAVEPDGEIVTVGSDSTHGLVVSRFEPNGGVDTSFGAQGTAGLDQYGALGETAALLPGGMILAGGTGVTGVGRLPLAARFGPDGALDTSFGEAGVAIAPTCQGSISQQRASGCLSVATATMRVHGLRRRHTKIRLSVQVNNSLDPMTSVKLVMPKIFRPRKGGARKLRVTALGATAKPSPASRENTVTIAGGAFPALDLTLPPSALRTTRKIKAGHPLRYRVRINFLDGNGQTVVFRRK
jgi:uncharacterized delta-60 repeat protein